MRKTLLGLAVFGLSIASASPTRAQFALGAAGGGVAPGVGIGNFGAVGSGLMGYGFGYPSTGYGTFGYPRYGAYGAGYGFAAVPPWAGAAVYAPTYNALGPLSGAIRQQAFPRRSRGRRW